MNGWWNRYPTTPGLLFLETHKDGDREVQLTLDRLREELLEKGGR